MSYHTMETPKNNGKCIYPKWKLFISTKLETHVNSTFSG